VDNGNVAHDCRRREADALPLQASVDAPAQDRLPAQTAVSRSDTDHRTIYLTGIDATGKVARASARSRLRELTALRPYGPAHFGPGLAMDTNCSD
jgi:hypothetical protein